MGVKGSSLSSAAARLVHSIFAEVRVAIVHVSCVSVVLCPRGLSPGCPNLGKRKQQSTKCCRSPRRDRHLFRILFPLHKQEEEVVLSIVCLVCLVYGGLVACLRWLLATVKLGWSFCGSGVDGCLLVVTTGGGDSRGGRGGTGFADLFPFFGVAGCAGLRLDIAFLRSTKKRCLCRSTHGGRKANQKVGVACAFPQDIRGASVAHGSGV